MDIKSPEIVIAIIAAFSAIAGGLVTSIVPLLQGFFDKKTKRDTLLRTKYEEVAFAFVESFKHGMSLLNVETPEEFEKHTFPNESNKMHLLCMVYFPTLTPFTGSYIDTYSIFMETLASLYNPEDERRLGAQVLSNPKYIEVRDAHDFAKQELQIQLEKQAPKYTKA